MKKVRYSFIAIVMVFGMTMTSCSKCDEIWMPKADKSVEEGPPTCVLDETPKHQLVFRDPGMCGGVWFERIDGVILEVYGCDPAQLGLSIGDWVTLQYAPYDDSELIQCEAICEYEVRCRQRGRLIKVVHIQ